MNELSEQRPKDSDIPRNRTLRYIVLGLWIILIPIISTLFVESFVSNFFTEIPAYISNIAHTVGFAIGVGITIITVNLWFIIKNPTTGMFMTVDTLNSFFGGNNVNVSYGPGNHPCLPTERRYRGNNISLEEATNKFDFKVQCSDGTLFGKGIFWARPDMINAFDFLTGVGSFSVDMEGLIISKIVSKLSKKKVLDSVNELDDLNTSLQNEFVSGRSRVEERFGIHIGNVVIEELLPSEELQKTIGSRAEIDAIGKGTLDFIGAESWMQVQEWLKEKTITQADISLARDRVLAISGNLEGMNINRNEIDFSIHGLDSDVAEAITSALNSPAGVALATKVGNKNQVKENRRGRKQK